MSKMFLGSVGKAEAFRKGADGKLQLAFVSKTLTDSGLNISTTKDDIRAGEGAPIQFSFYHDPNVEITLTDVLWKKEYLTAQLGAQFSSADGIDYITKNITGSDVLSGVKKMPVPCADGDQYIVWYTLKGQDDWQSYTSSSPIESAIPGLDSDKEYCVRYLGEESRAKVAEITSTIVPEELFLIITAPLFAGDACAASKGKAAGHITFEVPRFQLNGAQEFAMNMSQNQTMSLAGVALAGVSEDCDSNAGKLLRIIEVINDEDWYSGVESLIIDEESVAAGSAPVIYALKKNGELVKCDNAKMMWKKNGSSAYELIADKKFATGTYGINISKDGGIADTSRYLATDESVTVG